MISEVYWTLCLEVQLYLFFVFSLGICQCLSPRLNIASIPLHLIVILVVAIYSVFATYDVVSGGIKGLFLPYWHYFILGVLAHRCVKKSALSTPLFWAWMAFEIMAMWILDPTKAYVLAGVGTAIFIVIADQYQKLNSWLTYTPLLFLGQMSYCLYLLHPDIGWKVISLGKSLAGEQITPLESILILLAGVFVSIIASYIIHLAIEKPALIWSNHFKRQKVIAN